MIFIGADTIPALKNENGHDEDIIINDNSK